MTDRSISWRRTGGRTHVVTIDDGPLCSGPFAYLQAAANVTNQGLQAACNMQNAGQSLSLQNALQGPQGCASVSANALAAYFGV